MSSTSHSNDVIMNLTLAKISGLYQIINPDGKKIFGYNIYRVGVMFISACTLFCLSFCFFGLYYWINDRTQFVLMLTILLNFSFGTYKIITIVWKAKQFWKCMNITRFDFISSNRHNINMLDVYRAKATKLTGLFTVVCYIILTIWVTFPFVFSGKYIHVKNLNCTYTDYRFNPYNMFFPIPSTIYNDFSLLFHFIESINGLWFVQSIATFDTLMISMYIAIAGQLNVIANTYESLGYNSTVCQSLQDHEQTAINKKDTSDVTEHLICTINDHQLVLGKLRDFNKIIRPVILPQLIVASFTIISVSYITIMNYFNGMLLSSAQSLKFCSLPVFVCQLFYTCYIFEYIDTQKNMMNFSLYSSNWTHMNMKTKKLILLAMTTLNSNKLYMRLTIKMFLNLELFAGAIRVCYSILSLLINTQLKDTNHDIIKN